MFLTPMFLALFAIGEVTEPPQAPIEAVAEFAGKVLEKGRDRWSGRNTPLLADGVNLETWEPVEWRHREGRYVICNFSNQQNLLRTLVGLSNLTGDERYRKAARDATAYMLTHFQAPCGLLYWGEHAFVDLRTLTAPQIEDFHPAISIELLSVLPFYELLWEVDPEATARFICAYWNGLMLDWQKLEMTRHTQLGRPMGKLWENPIDPQVPGFSGGWFAVWHLPDSVYSAAFLARHTDEPGALRWAKHLNGVLIRGRHPGSGLDRIYVGEATGRDYGRELRATWDDDLRYAWFAREIYGNWRLAELHIAELLGDEGQPFRTWAVEGLKAFARHGYDAEKNAFRYLMVDGTATTEGGPRWWDEPVQPPSNDPRYHPAETCYLLTYARAWRMTQDAELWQTVRGMARGHGLGSLPAAPVAEPEPNLETPSSDPFTLLAVLEIYRGSGQRPYLELARRIGRNVIDELYVNGLFVDMPGQRYARFNALAPLALLHLEAAARGEFDAVPAFIGGHRRGLWGWFGGTKGRPRSGTRTSDIQQFYTPK